MKKSRKNLIGWIASGTIFLLFFALYLTLSPPFPFVPEIGRNLPSNFEEAEKVFIERVRSTFPIQTKETYIIHNLEEQGFQVNLKTKVAYFSKSTVACLLEWRINWSSKKDSITKIDARFRGSCL